MQDNGKIFPKAGAPVANLKSMKEALLSKDLSRGAEFDYVTDNALKFLDGTDLAD